MPKKSRNDVIRAAVGYYLKNKNYVGERFRKSDYKLTQNRQEFMLHTMQMNDLARGNSFTYSNHTITGSQQIMEQFGRFSQFVELQDECKELQRFYAPMLCHLYLELLKAREPEAAIEFLKKFAHLVAPVETFDVPAATKINGCVTTTATNDAATETSSCTMHHIRFIQNNSSDVEMETDTELAYFINLLQTLSTCNQLESAESNADVAFFRASKYEIHTTGSAVEALINYLEKSGHVLILNLLQSWIQIHIIDNEQPSTDDSIYFGSTLEEEMDEDDDGGGGGGGTGGGGGGGGGGVIECASALTIPIVKASPKIKSESHAKHASSKSNTASSSSTQALQAEIKTEQLDTEQENDTKKWREGRNVTLHLETLRTSREQLMKTPSSFPRCIKIADKDRGLTSAHLDADECHLVAGFNSSVIQLWQLNQRTCLGRSLFRRKTHVNCHWDLNSCHKETEDTIETHIEMHSSSTDDREKRKFFENKYEDNSYNEYGGIKLHGHGLGVTAVRFSSFYPLLYSVSKDTTMRSWHAESYNCAAVYRGHQYPIWCFDESPLGAFVVTGSKDLTARLWSTEHDFPLITFAGHSQDVECVAFHPNGNYIATGSSDLSVRLWCTTSGKLMRVFPDCRHAVTSVAFSPDGKLLAAAGEESKVRIFDLAACAQLGELKDHTASVTSIAWNSNGRQLGTACRDGSLRIWDTKRLIALHESSSSSNLTAAPSSSSSSSSTSTSSSPTRLIALNTNCQRLVKFYFGRSDAPCCVGC